MMDIGLAENLKTGSKEIDDQHEELFGVVGNMYDCQKIGDVDGCSKFLTNYTKLFEEHYRSELDLIMKFENNSATDYLQRQIGELAKLRAIKPICKINCGGMGCIARTLSYLYSHILRNCFEIKTRDTRRRLF